MHALTHPPYHLIRPPQSSPTCWQEASAEAYLLEALSSDTDEPPKKLISTKVRLNANATLFEDQVTRHSRTSLALEPHTDSSNQQNPHSIVIFGISRPDASEGLTQLISVNPSRISMSPTSLGRTTARIQRTVLINAEVTGAVTIAGLCGPRFGRSGHLKARSARASHSNVVITLSRVDSISAATVNRRYAGVAEVIRKIFRLT